MKVYVYVVFVWGTNVNTGWTDERQFNVLVVSDFCFLFCFDSVGMFTGNFFSDCNHSD